MSDKWNRGENKNSRRFNFKKANKTYDNSKRELNHSDKINEKDNRYVNKDNSKLNKHFHRVNETYNRNEYKDNYKINKNLNRVKETDDRNKKKIYKSEINIKTHKNEIVKPIINSQDMINTKKIDKQTVSESEKIDYWNCKKFAGVPFVEKQIVDSYLKIGMEVPDIVRKELSARK